MMLLLFPRDPPLYHSPFHSTVGMDTYICNLHRRLNSSSRREFELNDHKRADGPGGHLQSAVCRRQLALCRRSSDAVAGSGGASSENSPSGTVKVLIIFARS